MLVLCEHLLPSSSAADLGFAHPKAITPNPPTQRLSRGGCNLQLADVVQQLELVAPSASPPRSEIRYASLLLNS